jgi:succinoglycan biosynthesis protein ExoM
MNDVEDIDLTIANTPMVSIAICIASIGRPSLLTTLHSISNCRLPACTKINIVIADDSKDGAVAKMISNENNWSLAIRVVPTAAGNIAVARNACLNAASGDYIAFIDDDEWADQDWLINLIKQVEESRADAIFGPTIAIFPAETPNWMRRAAPFGNRVGLHGSEVNTGATSNVLVRRASIERIGLRFNEDFGRSGGEDTDFFARLHASGAKLLVSQTAKVFEPVPLERLRISHLYMRYMRGGQTYAKVIVARAPFVLRIKTYAIASIKIPIFIALAAVAYPVRKDLALKCAFKAWLNTGKLRHALGLPMFKLY